MPRPSKIPKRNTGNPSLEEYFEISTEAVNLTAASATFECQTALANSPAAARAALTKHGVTITKELAQALEKVGSYTNEHGRTSLHEAIIYQDAVIVEALLAAGAKMVDTGDLNDAAPNLDLPIDVHGDTCREIVEHHAAVLATITEDPSILLIALAAHCGALSASEELAVPSTALTLRAHQLDSSFLWVPPASRAAIIVWAQDAYIAQHAGTITLFRELIDDCAGDVLEFFEVTMTRTEALHISTYCSSPEARAWVRAVVAAEVVANATAELVSAAAEGDFESVQECLSKKANIDFKVDGSTALMLASYNGHYATVQILVEAGADKEAKDDKEGRTALIMASFQGHYATVQLLVEAGADKEVKDRKNGFTALIMASGCGHTATVQILVDAGVDIEAKDNQNGYTALMIVSGLGYTTIVRLLVDAGADMEATGDKGYTALLIASQQGNTETLQLLVEAGANKEANDNEGGFTALMIASLRGHTAIVQSLVEAGSDMEAKDDENSHTALIIASKQGYTASVKLLVEAGADTEAKDNEGGFTALMFASRGGHIASVRVLVEGGANKEAKDREGYTALIFASLDCQISTVQLLVEAGANKEAKDDKNGFTALILASCKGYTAIVQHLVEAGADIEAKDNDNYFTSLTIASANGHTATVRILLEAGADTEAKGKNGCKALIFASLKGQTETVQLLVEAGADKDAMDTMRGLTASDIARAEGHTEIVAILED